MWSVRWPVLDNMSGRMYAHSFRLRSRLSAALLLALALAQSGCEGDGLSSRQDRVRTSGDLDGSRRTALVLAVERAAPGVVGVFALAPRVRTPSLYQEFFWNFFPEFPRFRDEWVPQLDKPKETPIERIDVTTYRVPGAAPPGHKQVTPVAGVRPYQGDAALCVVVDTDK